MAHSKETIVKTAIDILNRDGADGLSMRTLAKELDIKAASLYWHFADKRDLFGAISEYMCESYEMPQFGGDVRAYLFAHYLAYRKMLLGVRDSVTVMENSIPNTPRRIEIIKDISGRLIEIGVIPENLMTVSNLLNNYVLSFVADETRFQNMPSEMIDEMLSTLDQSDRFMFVSKRDFDEQFMYGLNIIFAGISSL